jgi:hypothetical protein
VSVVVKSVMILVALGAAGAGIYKLKHYASSQHGIATVQADDTLSVSKGTQKYLLEPGRVYVPVGADARTARVEAADGYWFAISNKDGTIFRDCAKEPADIQIGSKPESSPYRVRLCGNGRHLVLTGK